MATGEHLGGTEGMSEAREAFQSAIDAETPSRSKSAKVQQPPERMDMDDLFPSRDMDRSEREGGLDEGPPARVKQARAEAKARGGKVLDDDGPRPVRDDDDEAIDNEDEDDDTEEQDEDEQDENREPEEASDEDEEDEEAVGQLDLDTRVEVNIDGEPAQVTLKEALRGYIRTETFHRRVNELQQGVAALQGQRTELDQSRQAFIERAQALEEYVKAFMPEEPNWDAIYAQNPADGARLERRWRSFQDQIGQLAERRSQMQAEIEATRIQNLNNFAQANRAKMIQAHPEWRHEKNWKRDHDSMRRTARTAGYTDEEINQLYDARGVEILLKAAKYDRLMATKPRPVKGSGTPTKVNGATPHGRNVSRSFDRAERRLSRTGSVADAARVFEKILDRER